jgi:SAM-dependent methyltransferase
MLERARQRAAERGTSVRFERGDIASADLGRTFDAAVLLFAVLGYQTETHDVISTLANARRHLAPGGLLALDVWYGPGVLAERPSERVKVVERIERRSTGTLDSRRHLCVVDFAVRRLDDASAEPTTESHPMRFFFPLELEHYLEHAGFELVRLGGFPEFEREPDDTTWTVMALARAAPA